MKVGSYIQLLLNAQSEAAIFVPGKYPMRKILILYPHWHPSNLAGVHRARLVGNFLVEFGWEPLVLTVKEEYYEEVPDPEIHRLFSPSFRIRRVRALPVWRFRLFGDIGLRAFFYLYREAKKWIREEKPEFLWIPIPSFYTALLGRMLHLETRVPYGIDYIDPWVRDVSKDSSFRARMSLWVAKILEPIAVKKASLITGVAEEYYRPVLERNFNYPAGNISHCAFPYGFDPHDHEIDLPDLILPWHDRPGCIPIVYAGAFMPNSQHFADVFFRALAEMKSKNRIPAGIHLYFLGTGLYPHKRLIAYAADHGVEEYVTEIRDRFPYLHILNFLSKADRLLIIGSTEKHYTASKIFQVILSKRPFFPLFHHESTAVQMLAETATDKYLVTYEGMEKEQQLFADILKKLDRFLNSLDEKWNPDIQALEPYSAKNSARILIGAIESLIEKTRHTFHTPHPV
jgi:hypothetical protein